MKLLRCNIVNYGCLHDFSYEFTDGINLIDRPNGWGKSTFVSFLCAMLYGLDSTTKRNIRDNERRHYQPWQGGSFGGSLEFEISGKSYRAERFFGKREKEDSFILYDLKTMLVSQDFSHRLGFELFGIDRSGFLRSICIPQGNPAIEYNDSLAARLTGLSQSTDDITQYEKAVSEIDKALRFYVKTGNRGEIPTLNQKLELIEHNSQESLQAVKEIEHVYTELNSLEQQKKQLCVQLESVQKQIEIISISEIQAHYRLLKQQLDRNELELEQAEIFFHDLVPEESDIDSYLLSCSHLSQILFQIQQQTFSEEQKTDFLLLKKVFRECSVVPELQKSKESERLPDRLKANDIFSIENPVFSSSGDLFSPEQKQLLIDSQEYHQEASALFSLEEDFLPAENLFSSDYLPDPDMIKQAREYFYQYQTLLSSLRNDTQTVSDLTKHLDYLQNSLEKERNDITACRQHMELLEKGNTSSSGTSTDTNVDTHTSTNSDAAHGFHKKSDCNKTFGSREDFHAVYQYAYAMIVPLLVIVLFSCLAGYFITPFAGVFTAFAGIIPIFIYFFRNFVKYFAHCTVDISDSDYPVSAENTARKEQIIQLTTEIQLRTASCIGFEEQIIQQRQKLVSAKEKAHTSALLTDTCRQKLMELSEHLNLPVTESFLISDEYLIQLSELSKQLEHYENIQQKQYEYYKKEAAFYEQLWTKYLNFHSCSQRLKKLEKTASDLKNSITDYLRPYYSVSVSDSLPSLEDKLHNLKSELLSYKKLLSDMHLSSQNMNLFFKEHPGFEEKNQIPTDTDLQNQPSRSLAELHSEEAVLRRQYTDCAQKINHCQSQIRQKQEIAGEHLLLEEQISSLKMKIKNYQDRYRILTLTKQYLIRARQNFTDNYLKSIEKHFNHYAKLIQKELLLNTRITSDFHTLISDNGVLKESDWYSQGTRDLIDLCSRLSIIEDLFPDEQPFLILDDPFVNLDEHSIMNLSSILHAIAGQWQILYFTCHSSRDI